MSAPTIYKPGGFNESDEEYSDDDGFIFGGDVIPESSKVLDRNKTDCIIYKGEFNKQDAKSSHWSPKNASWKLGKEKPPAEAVIKTNMNSLNNETSNYFENVIPADDFRNAVLRGNITALKKYIYEGFSVDTIFSSGWTALMYAGNSASYEAVSLLLEKGANPNFHANQYTVLMATVSSKKNFEEQLVKCVDLLIEKGAKIDDYDRYHMSALMYAAREGKACLVQRLMEHNANLAKQDSRGHSALTWAAKKGHLRVVQLLVGGGADINQQCSDGSNPADVAYNAGHIQVCNFLRKLGGELSFKKTMINTEAEDENLIFNTEEKPSSNVCVKYGEMELFLSGLELGHLIPVFQEQQVTFGSFLRYTDYDLQKLGVKQIGQRKKLLDAIIDTHKKSWETTSLPSMQYNKQISCPEAISVIANINKHVSYISSSVGFISDQLHEHPDILRNTQEGATVEEFCSTSETALANVKILYSELTHLRRLVGKMSEKEDFTPPDTIVQPKGKSRKQWHRILMACSLVTFMGLLVWKADDIAQRCSAVVSKILVFK